MYTTYIHTVLLQVSETFNYTKFILVRDSILKLTFCICNILKSLLEVMRSSSQNSHINGNNLMYISEKIHIQ